MYAIMIVPPVLWFYSSGLRSLMKASRTCRLSILQLLDVSQAEYFYKFTHDASEISSYLSIK